MNPNNTLNGWNVFKTERSMCPGQGPVGVMNYYFDKIGCVGLQVADKAKRTANETDTKEKMVQMNAEQVAKRKAEEEEYKEDLASDQEESEIEDEQAEKSGQEEDAFLFTDGSMLTENEEEEEAASLFTDGSLFTDEILQEKAAAVLQTKYSM